MNEPAIQKVPQFLDIKGVLRHFPLTARMAYGAAENGDWPNWRKPGRVKKINGKRVYLDGKRWMGPAADVIAWMRKFDTV